MSVRVRDVFMRELSELRYEPVDKRIRATLAGQPILDSKRAMLVWEPKRVVPSYAVPVDDINAALRTTPANGGPTTTDARQIDAPKLGDLPVLDPSVPFSAHTAAGEALTIHSEGGEYESAAFRAEDAALSGYVIVDFNVFDAWYEEEERNQGHPRDPFHRIEIVHSSRHVQVAVDDTVIAESSRPYLLFEPPLPVRYYLPREDVRTDLLTPSDTRTVCAYKGKGPTGRSRLRRTSRGLTPSRCARPRRSPDDWPPSTNRSTSRSTATGSLVRSPRGHDGSPG